MWVFEKVPLLKVSDLERTEAWFAKHGTKAIFLGRMVPIFRSLISLPAGVEKMPLALFLALTTAGSLLWNSIFVVAGYRLGENWEVVGEYVSYLEYPVIIAAVLAVVWYVWKRILSRPRSGRASPTTD